MDRAEPGIGERCGRSDPMAPYFSEKQIAELYEGQRKLTDRYLKLLYRIQSRKFNSERGREHAFHGFLRRLGTLAPAVNQVFSALPPELDSIPDRDALESGTIGIQAFVLNVVGCLDNLAWIWVYEKDVKSKNGTELDPKSVGLWRRHVRSSLSRKLQDHLDKREPWAESIKGFRDSLAHRIPLYIAPYGVRASKLDDHYRLEQEATAAVQRRDFLEYERLREDQKKLGEFRPWMRHSFHEQSPTIVFHYQLLADYATIDELGSMLFEELEAK